MASIQDTQPRGWWARNWKWAVPAIGCLGMLMIVPLACVAGVALLFTSMRNSWACTEGVELARLNPEVVQALGKPIEVGWIVSGSINSQLGGTGDANFEIPIYGPKNTATVYVIAHKRAGEWKFERAEVEIDGAKERINLLQDAKQDKTACWSAPLLGRAGLAIC